MLFRSQGGTASRRHSGSRSCDQPSLKSFQLANDHRLPTMFGKGGVRILADRGPAADAIIPWMLEAALWRGPDGRRGGSHPVKHPRVT